MNRAPLSFGRRVAIIALAVALMGIGFWLGRASQRGVKTESLSSTTTPKTIASETVSPANAPQPSIASKPQISTADKTSWNDDTFDKLTNQPRTPASAQAIAAMLESLAAVNPDRAMALAQAEHNLKLKDTFIQATLRGWAKLAPVQASEWALNLSDANAREKALSSVFNGCVAKSPDEAVRLGKTLIQKHPEEGIGFGSRLIDTLCSAGQFEAATQMASAGDAQQRSFWISGAYSRWAEFQPEQAASAAAALSDPVLRKEALHGIVGGWAEADPVALVQFTEKLPQEYRGEILGQTLQYWVRHDPEAAAQWINARDPGPDFDQGIASVATTDAVAPKVAVDWADSIMNPQLRSETLALVLRSWFTSDAAAAKNYFEKTRDLLPEQRKELASVFSIDSDSATQ